MALPSATTHITRRELYAAVAPVWIYIMMVIGNTMRSGVRWPEILLFGGAAVSAAMYLRMAYRARAV